MRTPRVIAALDCTAPLAPEANGRSTDEEMGLGSHCLQYPWMLRGLLGLVGTIAGGVAVCLVAPGLLRLPQQQRPQAVRTLSANSSTTTTVTWARTRDIKFVTMETRGDPILTKVGHFEEAFHTRIVNTGEGQEWDGYKSKIRILQTYFHELVLEGAGEELMAYADGADVIWGGCDAGYFQHAYEEIVRLSGARVVFSAEIACGEQDCSKVPPVPDWVAHLAGGKDVGGDFWKPFVDGCRRTWTDACARKRDCGGMAACAEPPVVKFLNSGFFVGPVADLARMLDWSLDNYDNASVWGDQSVLAEYWLNNQQLVTLDYTFSLAASISDMRWELLEAPLRCPLDQWVYLTSHRNVQLWDDDGRVRFSPNKTREELWMLSDAGAGRYWITSSKGRQLVDSERFVSLSIFKSEQETWRLSVGSHGIAYLTSANGEQLQDAHGHPVFSKNRQGWETWRIHTLADSPACEEGTPVHGAIVNQALHRKQCFIHGNGRGFWFFGHVVRSLTGDSPEAVRDWGKHLHLHKR